MHAHADPRLARKRQNCRDLAELLVERLRFHGMAGLAAGFESASSRLGVDPDKQVVVRLRRAWGRLVVPHDGPSLGPPLPTRAEDVDPDLRLLADAVNRAVGNLKVYVRYGLHRDDVDVPGVSR